MARSSASWRGGVQPDIIDLDRYMRAGVRPSDDISDDQTSDQLIVDAGGLRQLQDSTSESSREKPRSQYKRYSHDSGLSDGSYVKRRHRTHRRHPPSEPIKRPQTVKEDSSIREFRVVCQKALLEQQQQLARVTQLCEKLTEKTPVAKKIQESSDTSDLSSTSGTTGDERKKDRNRTQECKTYKIIMNKLDELNRVFVQRGRSPPGRSSPRPVTVIDKVVTTDTDRYDAVQHPQENSGVHKPHDSPFGRDQVVMRSTTQTYSVDIAPKVPRPQRDCPNVFIESVVKSEDGLQSGNRDPRCGFDLNDPVKFYSQAKSLEIRHARPGYYGVDQRRAEDNKSVSLCAVCRGYWKSLWRYLMSQLNNDCKS